MIKKYLIVSCFLFAQILFGAVGDYEAGTQAVQNKDYKEAIRLFQIVSEAGDKRGDHWIGYFYANGLGVEKNLKEAESRLTKAAIAGFLGSINGLTKLYLGYNGAEAINIQKARKWARISASTGDAEGMYLVCETKVLDPELNFLENGKANVIKYNKLSSRTIEQRSLDIEAYNMLARSAKLKYQKAESMLALFYSQSVGEGNSDRALAILNNTKLSIPVLANTKKGLEFLKRMGNTKATYKIVVDAQATAMLAALMKTYGVKRLEECEASNIKFVKMESIGEIINPVYLPLTEEGMQKAILIGGKWDEKWTYNLCGKETEVLMTFTADGLSGAYFRADFK
jgi:TPR repeat protein